MGIKIYPLYVRTGCATACMARASTGPELNVKSLITHCPFRRSRSSKAEAPGLAHPAVNNVPCPATFGLKERQ